MCVRAATAVWIGNNEDRHKANKQAQRKRNPSLVRDQKKTWRKANADSVSLHKAASYKRHRSAIRAKNDAWAKENREAVRAIRTAWDKRHPDRVRAMRHRIRAVRRAAEGSFSAEQLSSLFQQQQSLCNACARSIASGYHVDHIIPLSRGGTNWIENIQLLCAPCNLSKGAKMPDQNALAAMMGRSGGAAGQ